MQQAISNAKRQVVYNNDEHWCICGAPFEDDGYCLRGHAWGEVVQPEEQNQPVKPMIDPVFAIVFCLLLGVAVMAAAGCFLVLYIFPNVYAVVPGGDVLTKTGVLTDIVMLALTIGIVAESLYRKLTK